MFESVLKKRKNPLYNLVGWFLLTVATIALAFIGLTGGSSLFNTGGAAAEVNSEMISSAEVLQIVKNQERGKTLTTPQRKELENQVLDSLIKKKLILQAAKDENIFVSDQEVFETIQQYPIFIEEGKFSRSKYKNVFEDYKRRGVNIEEQIREDLLVQKVSGLFSASLDRLSLEQEKEDVLKNTKLNIGFVELNKDKKVTRTASADEISQFVQDEKNQARIQSFYDNNKSTRFTNPEKVRASILLITAPEDDMNKSSEALGEIEKIKKEINFDNFEEMVAKHSEDPQSKAKNGDLGFFEKGSFDKKLESAAFSMKKGDVSDPIKTEQGYTLIKLTDRIEAEAKELDDELKKTIAKTLIAQDEMDRLFNEAEKAVQTGEKSSVDQLIGSYKLKWDQTDFFNLGAQRIPKIGLNEQFLSAAIGLKEKGDIHNSLIRQGSKAYIIRLNEMRVEDSKDDPMKAYPYFAQLMSRARVEGALNSWTESIAEEASIKKNPNYLQAVQ